MSNQESIIMLDLSSQMAYLWARARAKWRYGQNIRSVRICDPEAFAHPAEKDFEMGLFVSQNYSSTDSGQKNYAILFRKLTYPFI